MRRDPLLLIVVGVVLVLAAIPAVVLSFQQPNLVTEARSVLSPLPSLASTSAFATATLAATPQPTAAQPAAAVAPAPPRTAVTARISIPSLGIRNAPVYDRGTDSKGNMLIAPGYAVTHYTFSAAYGTGNAVLYGHDDIQGSIFGRLYYLAPGDIIQLTVGADRQTYRVSGHQIVAPTAVDVLAPSADIRLTIITCWPFDVDTKRWIVTAFKI